MEWIREIVEKVPFVDTHEHLLEETTRTASRLHPRLFPCDDWAYLFLNYVSSDLHSAGMPPDDRARFFAPETPSARKERLVAPWWARIAHTGYARALRHTLRELYGVQELTPQTVEVLDHGYRALAKPGFYRHILRDRCNIDHCQVNSSERIFMETAQPDLLRQDLSTVALATEGPDLEAVKADSGRTATTLEGWTAIIDWYFATYGPQAVAVKNQSAYARRLDYADVSAAVAAPLFALHARGESLEPTESKALQDHLFRHCLTRATECGLPVKLHTGYYAGNDHMPLERVGRNAADLCPLLEAYPDTRFVLMHIGYPYQDEYLALAKHYRNVWVDMCWAWIINPEVSVRFLQEMLVSAPANKILGFGGDYFSVETVVGHADLARRGITRALAELVEKGWIGRDDVEPLARRIMRENALEVFPRRGL